MAEKITPANAEQGATTVRVEAAVRRLQELYSAEYGSEYAALIRPAHELDFDL